MFKLLIIIRPIILGGCFLSAPFALAGDDTLDNIKSVYIYNFLSFIQWPAHNSPTAEYRLCAIADQGLINKLESVVRNEQVNGRTLAVATYQHLHEVKNCHLIYLQSSTLTELELMVGFDQPGTLLIGDADKFVSQGMGMVGFETRGRKVRVAMNLTRLQEAGFKVSSKLLRFVRIEY